jgi:predicted Zn-dependent peptidase
MMGRRITRTAEQRIQDLQIAIRRSGFTQQEVYEILRKWYGEPPTGTPEQVRELDIEDFKRFCKETVRLHWAEYANIPVMLEFAKWVATTTWPIPGSDGRK